MSENFEADLAAARDAALAYIERVLGDPSAGDDRRDRLALEMLRIANGGRKSYVGSKERAKSRAHEVGKRFGTRQSPNLQVIKKNDDGSAA